MTTHRVTPLHRPVSAFVGSRASFLTWLRSW